MKSGGRSYWKAVHPFNLGGGYVNFMMDDEVEGRVQASYGDNYARLASVKAKYDPSNLFRVNQNIAPAATAPHAGSSHSATTHATRPRAEF